MKLSNQSTLAKTNYRIIRKLGQLFFLLKFCRESCVIDYVFLDKLSHFLGFLCTQDPRFIYQKYIVLSDKKGRRTKVM